MAARRMKQSSASAAAGKADSMNCDEQTAEDEMDVN